MQAVAVTHLFHAFLFAIDGSKGHSSLGGAGLRQLLVQAGALLMLLSMPLAGPPCAPMGGATLNQWHCPRASSARPHPLPQRSSTYLK